MPASGSGPAVRRRDRSGSGEPAVQGYRKQRSRHTVTADIQDIEHHVVIVQLDDVQGVTGEFITGFQEPAEGNALYLRGTLGKK